MEFIPCGTEVDVLKCQSLASRGCVKVAGWEKQAAPLLPPDPQEKEEKQE
jgi:hypothetical protein